MTRATFVRLTHAPQPRSQHTPARGRAVWRRPVVLGASAVVLALAAVATTLVLRRAPLDERAAVIAIHPHRIVPMLADQGTGLPSGLAPAWDDAASPWWLSRRARAVRIGVRHVDLQILAELRVGQTKLAYYGRDSLALAIVARSAEQSAALAAANAQDMARLPGGDSAASHYRRARNAAAARDFWGIRLWAAGREMPQAHARHVMLGSWLQGARVAALRGDRAFFRQPESRAIAASMARLPRLPRDERAALERVRTLATRVALVEEERSVATDASRADLAALQEALTRALGLLTS